MTLGAEIHQLLNASSPTIYIAVFVMAVLEGFIVTTYVANGTIGFVVLGGLMARGDLNAPATLGCIYVGTIIGDTLTYVMAHRLQQFAWVARYQQTAAKYRAPLAQSPFMFVVLAHLTPYLKGMSAFLASGVVPWRAWLRAEAVGALCGTLLFTGLGAAGVQVFMNAGSVDTVTLAGISVFAAFILLWVRALRPCRIAGICSIRGADVRVARTWWKRLFFVLYFPFWHPVRWLEGAARRLPSRSAHPDMARAFPGATAGDIFLVRLHAPAPWGRWAHTAISVNADGFCHGFGDAITAHRFDEFPVRYTVAHLRVKCAAATAALAARAAEGMVGRPVKILAHRDDTSTFSCTSLVHYAYRTVGLDLAPEITGRVVPDDLFHSPHVTLLRIVHTEGASKIATPEGAPSAHQPV